ncbi:hypothetical protein E5S69_11630 [Cupriavidus necator]|uniref:hypothetical protein n=1 Tax=Cupriavidus necator TaxID=106590 RepID=UPI0014905E42|nr:hypothetical protein [Cupriavidus necator]NOV24162.1 hypothetical protein [Cupriavidus necator]
MATRRYSINPEDSDHQITDAVGAATATKNIELTVDWDTLRSAGLSEPQARMQVLAALERLHAYIETTGKYSVAG